MASRAGTEEAEDAADVVDEELKKLDLLQETGSADANLNAELHLQDQAKSGDNKEE